MWTTVWPTQVGWYWFYGQYTGEPSNRLTTMQVKRAANGFLYIAEGEFYWPSEFESAHFLPLEPPALP